MTGAVALAPSRQAARSAALPVVYPSPEALRHYFAVCNDAFLNLPSEWDGRYRNARALRQHILCRVGYCTYTDVVYATDEAAREASVLVKPASGDDYVLATCYDNVVQILRPKSQSARALPSAEFFALRDRVFGVLGEMIGVDPVTLLRQAGRSA